MIEKEKSTIADQIELETLKSGKSEIDMKNTMAKLMKQMPIPVLDEFTEGSMDCRHLLQVYEDLLAKGTPLMSLQKTDRRSEYSSEKSWKTDLIINSKRAILEGQQEEIREIKNKIFRVNSEIIHNKTKELLLPEKKDANRELSFCKGGGLSMRSRENTPRTEECEPVIELGEEDSQFDMMKLQDNLSIYEEDETKGESKKKMKEDLNIILEMNSIIYSTIQSMDRLENITSKDELLNLQKKNELLIKALRAKKYI